MLTDRDRIARQMTDMAAVRLARSLSRLTSVITFMNVGAHPDDESSGLLAALRYRFGFRIVIACSTRGEGGQSDLGPERGVALAALRTRETEEAARQLDASIAWLGFGPGDGVSDFGFSRNADDTLARWGETRLLSRLVEAYRRWRPDIVAPTFLDVPGQHGHHRAMTRSAIKAVDLAADGKAFPEQIAAGLAPWRVAKLYLPAWSGAGSSYDDEVPPPPATTVVRAPGRDWLTGATYSQIGEWSRFFHASQGMGVWRDPGPEAWPLHLAVSQGGSGRAEQGIEDGLPRAVGDLAAIPGLADGPRKRLLDAQRAIESAVRAFPDRAQIIDGAAAAARAIDDALAGLSARLRPLLAHKLERKRREIGQVLVEAQGIVVRVVAQPDRIPPGEETSVAVTVDPGDPPVPLAARLETRDGLVGHGEPARASATLTASARDDAGFTSPFAPDFDPLGPNGNMSVRVDSELGGLRLTHHVDLDNRLRVLPAASLTVDPEALIVNLARPVAPIMLRASADAAAPDLTLAAPAGWTVTPRPGNATTAAWTIEPPAHLASGRFEFAPRIDGRTAYRIVTASYAHVGEVAFARPASIAGLAVDAALPDGARVGYVGGGNDNVAVWLKQLGVAVTELAAERLAGGAFDDLTTIVVGIFAFGKRADLAAARPRLNDWVEAGGHLVTLYHRPSDGWSPETTPPRYLKIGSPSLRFRVTDPAAPVTVLAPDHPLLNHPNTIGDSDWADWDKERGLYFAAGWDAAYRPLLSLNDAGEPPLEGALVSARVGEGRHTHVSLALHHQLDKLVAGAFRLIANLIQPA